MKIIKTKKYKIAQHEMDMNRYEAGGMMGDTQNQGEFSQNEVFEDSQNQGSQYVSVYEVQRAYGGAEEGGWWYDTYSLIDTTPVSTREAAEKVKDFMEKKYKESNEESGPLSSSRGFGNLPEGTEDYQIPRGYAGEASQIEVIIENEPGENTTKERPHYE